MIDKFNFYDIYGYFLPGVAFLAVLWTPFGLVKGTWPASDWSSALIAAAIAYFFGHLLQNVATNAIPSKRGARYSSDFYLDPADTELPTALKGKIAQLVESQFGLDLEISKKGDQNDKSGVTTIDKVRNNAFRLARQVLIQGKAVSYAEQFQGMYALTRGLLAVFALACAYWLGWFFASERSAGLWRTAIVLVGAAIPVLLGIHLLRDKVSHKETKHKLEIAYACVLIIMFLAVGYMAGFLCYVSWDKSGVLAFMVVCALIACFRFKSAYESFAGLFASTVWRDYLAYNVQSGNCPKPLAGEE